MVAWCERDRPAGDAEVRARLAAWIPEYEPPGGRPPAGEAGTGAGTATPLRVA
jgi:hypothetical protein